MQATDAEFVDLDDAEAGASDRQAADDQAAEGEMAMCGYTWAMIIERLARQVGDGERKPYFRAGEPLPR